MPSTNENNKTSITYLGSSPKIPLISEVKSSDVSGAAVG